MEAARKHEYKEHRLHPDIEAFIVERCDPQHRNHARIQLDFGHDLGPRQFEEALEGDVEVHRDVMDSSPQEVCVKGFGTTPRGTWWDGRSIILLAPDWDRDADASRHVADVIVENWDEIRRIHMKTRSMK